MTCPAQIPVVLSLPSPVFFSLQGELLRSNDGKAHGAGPVFAGEGGHLPVRQLTFHVTPGNFLPAGGTAWICGLCPKQRSARGGQWWLTSIWQLESSLAGGRDILFLTGLPVEDTFSDCSADLRCLVSITGGRCVPTCTHTPP